ncbi:alpha-(1,3)-fucosyltransferase C-like [Aricia agestis]|uniref:alpha-(1,3)-fucosyltransferase C-like n=1 Tax=Aricia agestis TaxID=91739 RepID=UPI001C20490B|nr:alpha-(1,3)-fucosyltransferase C-like [Aricia agestis]
MALCRRYFPRLFAAVVALYLLTLLHVYRTRLWQLRATRHDISHLNHTRLRYVLQWTRRFSAPFDFMGEGNSAFVRNRCRHTNCYVTDDADYFLNQSDFDAIAFNGRDVIHLWPFQMPSGRTPRQKYIFGAMESPDNFPACDEALDGFFNWTWTYRLDSDFRWGYITIYDRSGAVVGPKIDMHWPPLDPVNDQLKWKLSGKTLAAAWFVSHCRTRRRREDFVAELQTELARYGLAVDVYGACGDLDCPRGERACDRLLERSYHFYLSFENSFAEDYVTEKLLTALDNYAVPIVYGAANYSRFLPPGSYLDARALGPAALARTMSELIANKSLYYEFFRWRNHYTYRETSSTDDVCRLCEMLNDDDRMAETTVWKDFRSWWNGAQYEENCT